MKYLFALICVVFTLVAATAQDTILNTDTNQSIRSYKMLDFSKGFVKQYYAQKWARNTKKTLMLSNFNKNIFTPQLHLPAVHSEPEINNILGRSINIFKPSNLPLNSNPFSAENSKYNRGYTLVERLFYSALKR